MILAWGIVTGFQNEIREKVLGFGSHIQVEAFGSSSKQKNPKLEINQDFYPAIDTVDGVKSVHIYALKEGVIETPENIQGIMAKGVSDDYDWSFIESHLVEGTLLFGENHKTYDLLLSKYLAQRLQLKLGDKIPIYFQNARNSMSQRNFNIVGVYETGLKELDEEFVFISIDPIRKINQWGVAAYLTFEGCIGDSISLLATGNGSDGDLRFKWNVDSLRGPGPHTFCTNQADTFYCVVTDRHRTLGDTAFFAMSNATRTCHCPEESEFTVWNSGGSYDQYTGGFEINLESYDDLDGMNDFIYEHLNYNLKTSTIKQHLPEIFNWLEMLDLNTLIIIALMIFISIINMTSALLILIMERTQMIGLLKAMGSSSWFVQKIFLYQAGYIIGIGLLVGNLLGIGLSVLQKTTGFVKLDPANYYVSEVPVNLDFSAILILNAITFFVCILALTLPSLAVTRIQPAKVMRYD